MLVSINRGPQYRPPNTTVFMMDTCGKGLLVLEKPDKRVQTYLHDWGPAYRLYVCIDDVALWACGLSRFFEVRIQASSVCYAEVCACVLANVSA